MVKFSKITGIFLIVFLAFFAIPFCQAQDAGGGLGQPGGGFGQTGGSYSIPNPLGETTIIGLVEKVINVLITDVLTPLVVVMLIWAGFKFATAGGNPADIEKAKKNLVYTITGLAIILLAQSIITFVRKLLGDEEAPDDTLLPRVKGALNEIIVVLFMLATTYFAWGIVQMIKGSGETKAVEQGRKHMVWGIIGMVIMAGAWGITNLLKDFLGV